MKAKCVARSQSNFILIAIFAVHFSPCIHLYHNAKRLNLFTWTWNERLSPSRTDVTCRSLVRIGASHACGQHERVKIDRAVGQDKFYNISMKRAVQRDILDDTPSQPRRSSSRSSAFHIELYRTCVTRRLINNRREYRCVLQRLLRVVLNNAFFISLFPPFLPPRARRTARRSARPGRGSHYALHERVFRVYVDAGG